MVGWAVPGLAAIWLPVATPLWYWAGIGLLLVAGLDAYRGLRIPAPRITRTVSPVLAVHRPATVRLDFENRAVEPIELAAFDHHHGPADSEGIPAIVSAAPKHAARLEWKITPRMRGEIEFSGVALRIVSPFGLWQRRCFAKLTDTVRVFPDFSMLSWRGHDLDARLARSSGFRQVRKRGLGTDFHQLREYRPGDTLSQVDWKASSRHRTLICREYEAEKGQQVVVLLDSSRRMRSADGELSHFDASLMSVLRLAHVALSRGDAVGCLTFGGTSRWVPPRRGISSSSLMLDMLYDVHPGLGPPDYQDAAQQLLRRQRRRALVVLVTNLRDEDNDELIPAVRILGRHHLVVTASLRERLLDDIAAAPVRSFDDAALSLAQAHYMHQRHLTLARLQAEVRHIVDAPATRMAPMLISQYLAIKQSEEL